HSGAPVLDPQNRVVAVANGGLKAGTVGISWAIPYRDVRWERAASSAGLAALSRHDSHVLFSFDDNPRAISNKIDEIRGSLGELPEEQKKTRRLIEPMTGAERLRDFEVLRHSYLLGFRSSLAVVLRAGGHEPNPARAKLVEDLLARARSHASYLGVG